MMRLAVARPVAGAAPRIEGVRAEAEGAVGGSPEVPVAVQGVVSAPPSASGVALDLARDALRAAAEGQVPRFSHRRSPRTYTQHQLFALLAVRRFLGWDFRAMASLASRSPSLRGALGLASAPHYSTLCYAEGRLLEDGRIAALLADVVDRARLPRGPGTSEPGAA